MICFSCPSCLPPSNNFQAQVLQEFCSSGSSDYRPCSPPSERLRLAVPSVSPCPTLPQQAHPEQSVQGHSQTASGDLQRGEVLLDLINYKRKIRIVFSDFSHELLVVSYSIYRVCRLHNVNSDRQYLDP